MTTWWILGIVLAVWLILYLIPDVLFHHFQLGAFSGSREAFRVAITFDDGPGPDTPAILDELKALNVRATFFVIADRARAHPDVIRRMVEDGHEIGLHMARHVSAFLLWPWQSFRLVHQGLDQVAALTGQRPVLFRPPWGHVNLGTWLAIHRYRLTPVFWNLAPDDWRPDHSPEYISHYVVQMSQPGAVVVLHDAGGPRERTVRALPAMVDGLARLGLKAGPVGEISHDPSMLRRIWTWWEIRFTRGWDIETIPNSAGGEPFLRIGHIRYRGPEVVLGDGVVMRRGDPMGEIHFGNPALAQVSGRASSALRVMHGVMVSLSDLTLWLKQSPSYQDIRAIGGVTLLDAARTIEKLGFHRVPVRGWTKWSMWIYLVVLMAIYHRDGWKTLRRFPNLKPVMVLMTKEQLMARYERQRTRTRR